MDIRALVGSVTLSSMTIGHVKSLSDKVDEIGVLAPNSEALFCEQLEVPESITLVVPAVAEVAAVCMLAPDPLEPTRPLASVECGG